MCLFSAPAFGPLVRSEQKHIGYHIARATPRHASRGKSAGNISCYCTIVQMQNNKMSDLEYEGQSDGAQHPQWCHSVANVNLYKVIPAFQPLLSPIFYINILNV